MSTLVEPVAGEGFTLFKFQEEGKWWLSKNHKAYLADEMGLGKTVQVICAADLIRAQKILVLCPSTAKAMWHESFKMFSYFPRTIQVVKSGKDVIHKSSDTIICSYDLYHDKATVFGDWRKGPDDKRKYDLVIFDEAHFLKNPKSKRTQSSLGKKGAAHFGLYTWCISGTPMPNNPAEMWPIMYTFGKTKLSYDAFIRRYCDYYEDPRFGVVIKGTNQKNLEELRFLLSEFMLRRKKEDVLKDLPPIFYSDIFVEPSEVDLEDHPSFIKWIFPVDRRREFFDQLIKERRLLEETIETIGSGGTAALFRALEAMATSLSTLRMYVGMQKVGSAIELVKEELDSGQYEKIVIFAIHQKVIDNLRKGLRDYNPVTLYGGTPVEKRAENVAKFQNEKHCKVFIGNITAAGTAITLTASHHVLFVEQDWTPGNNAQAAMRCHRIGQKKPVTVRFMSLENSVDLKVSQALKRKAREISALLDQDLKRVGE